MKFHSAIAVHFICVIYNVYQIIAIELPSVDENKIKFYFWDKSTIEQVVTIGSYGNMTKKPTKILIHGYLDLGNGEDFTFYGPFVQKYIKTGFNVVCVDWSIYAHFLYTDSVKYVRPVGEVIAKFITGLRDQVKIAFSDIHLLGHSLGSHISGFAGKSIQKKSKNKIGRITGIDPAGPSYFNTSESEHLWKTDATNVDTIIADIYLFGMNQTLGHVNFYVWCGANLKLLALNHLLAPFYYDYGIDRKDVVAKQCVCTKLQIMEACKPSPTNILGQYVDFQKPGNYYINLDVMQVMMDARLAMRTAPKSILQGNVDAVIASIKNALNLDQIKNKKRGKIDGKLT